MNSQKGGYADFTLWAQALFSSAYCLWQESRSGWIISATDSDWEDEQIFVSNDKQNYQKSQMDNILLGKLSW